MASKDYDDLLQSFMNNSAKAYEPYFSNAQEEKGDNDRQLKPLILTDQKRLLSFLK